MNDGSKTKPVSWLHISDLHVKEGDPYDRDTVLNSFLTSSRDLLKYSHQIDLILFSGDLANSGRTNEYIEVTKFFDKLLEQFSLSKERLIVIPGNHDIDREKGVGLARTLTSEEESVAYFSGKEDLPHANYRLAAFRHWYDEYFSGIRAFPLRSSCFAYETIEVEGARVGILPINTALFSFDDNDHGKLWIGRRCLDNVVASINKSSCLATIALLHHPLDWLNEIERQHVTRVLRDNVDCILSGHLHNTDAEAVTGARGDVFSFAAGALYQTRRWPNTAMFSSAFNDSFVISPIRYEDGAGRWTIDTSVFSQEPNFTKSFPRSNAKTEMEAHMVELENKSDAAFLLTSTPATSSAPAQGQTLSVSQAKANLERDLFVTRDGKALYVEPRISDQFQGSEFGTEGQPSFTPISELIGSTDSFFIDAPTEFGATTLAKKLLLEFTRQPGVTAVLHDANSLPNYRAKLRSVFDRLANNAQSGNILILDRFDNERHEKLLNELNSLDVFSRVILISRTTRTRSEPVRLPAAYSTKLLFLWALDRNSIRELAKDIFDSADDMVVSGIVEKVYSDLLALCIPLTPSNVIMYVRVLQKEGDFLPFNRVDIVARFLSDAFSKPSDLYAESFGVKEKLDVISSFCYSMYCNKRSSFTNKEWFNFCEDYIRENLVSFEPHELLFDLESSRIVIRWGENLYLKYAFFFTFLVGRHISSRSNLTIDFISSEDRNSLDGIVEVISGLSTDNTVLTEKLLDELSRYISEFEKTYIGNNFDPLLGASWPENSEVDEKLWNSVEAQVEKGPVKPRELDVIRTSLTEESRSQDQDVKYRNFLALEFDLFRATNLLQEALRAGSGVKGDLKKRAVSAILQTHLITYQIGTVLAPKLAESNLIGWGGLRFIGFKSKHLEKGQAIATADVIARLPQALMQRTSHEFASKKLGEVFRVLANEDPDAEPGFIFLDKFACVVTAKSPGWFEVAERMIQRMDKNKYYLLTMLRFLVAHYRLGIDLGQDKQKLARLVAQIRAKRQFKKNAPGSSAVTKMLKHLETTNQIAPESN